MEGPRQTKPNPTASRRRGPHAHGQNSNAKGQRQGPRTLAGVELPLHVGVGGADEEEVNGLEREEALQVQNPVVEVPRRRLAPEAAEVGGGTTDAIFAVGLALAFSMRKKIVQK